MHLSADELADRLLRLDGPYHPDAVVEAAATIAELVRRLNHATFHFSALRYPAQLYRVVGSLNAAVWGLQQLLGQLAARLDRWADDPRLGHDGAGVQAAEVATQAADALRQAAAARRILTDPLEHAHRLTSHLNYRENEPQR